MFILHQVVTWLFLFELIVLRAFCNMLTVFEIKSMERGQKVHNVKIWTFLFFMQIWFIYFQNAQLTIYLRINEGNDPLLIMENKS